MTLRPALVATLVIPFFAAIAGPVAPSYAAAMCQGRPATIEVTSGGTVTGTNGDDVIVATGPNLDIDAMSGNDFICLDSGQVRTGPGDDSVYSSASADGPGTRALLYFGNDTFTSLAGPARVSVYEVTSVHITITSAGRPGDAVVELEATSTPGTGTIDFGPGLGFLSALGHHRSRVDLAGQTARVDGLLSVTTRGVKDALATGCKVRMKGDASSNRLFAYGHNVIASGGGGNDRLFVAGPEDAGFGLRACHGNTSEFRGQGGRDRLVGGARDDVLIGGRGRDVADGDRGIDTCRAEIRKNCER